MRNRAEGGRGAREKMQIAAIKRATSSRRRDEKEETKRQTETPNRVEINSFSLI